MNAIKQKQNLSFLLMFGVLLLTPLILFLASSYSANYLKGLVVLFCFLLLSFLYKKWPFILPFIILPAIIVGPVVTLNIRDYTYEISLAEILILAGCLIFLIEQLGRPLIVVRGKTRLNWRITSVGWAFLVFIFLSALSLLWADNLSRTLIAVRVLSYHFLVFFLVVNIIKTKKDFWRALWALPITAFLVASQLFYKVMALGGLNTIFIPERTQLTTPVGSWVFISAIIVLCTPLSLSLLLTASRRLARVVVSKQSLFTSGWLVKPQKASWKKWWQNPLLFGLIIFSVLSSLFTLGKGEILSLVAGMAYFLKKQPAKKWLTGLLVALVLILVGVFFAQYSGQFWQRIVGTLSDRNTRFRVEEFKTGLGIFASHPLFGVGAGNLKLVYRQALPWFVETESNNIIIQVAAELGVMGLLALGFLGKTIVDVFKKISVGTGHCPVPTNEKILLLGFVSTMIVALVNSMLEVTFIGLNYGIIFWYILGLLVCAMKHETCNL